MTNPFDSTEDQFLVLVNHEWQHSLWPGYLEVPDGWEVAHGPAGRAACLEFVERNWTDIAPAGSRKDGNLR